MNQNTLYEKIKQRESNLLCKQLQQIGERRIPLSCTYKVPQHDHHERLELAYVSAIMQGLMANIAHLLIQMQQ
jgi:hypothetical protein